MGERALPSDGRKLDRGRPFRIERLAVKYAVGGKSGRAHPATELLIRNF